MEVHVGFTGWEWSFWLSKCFFINEWRFALDSQDCKDVFCEASAFLLMNGSLGWIHGVEIKFLITFFFFFHFVTNAGFTIHGIELRFWFNFWDGNLVFD